MMIFALGDAARVELAPPPVYHRRACRHLGIPSPERSIR
jgi:hypothetical protein